MNVNSPNSNLPDLDAGHYVKNSALQNNLAHEVLNKVELSADFSILDVGCGDGRITAELAERVNQGKVLGIDASAAMIEFALETFPSTKIPNLNFVHKMAEEVDFPEQFNLVVSFSCFHWLRDPQTALKQLSSALKPNGEMVILTYPKESAYYKYLEMALKSFPDYQHLSANLRMLSGNDYKNLLVENQMKVLDFEERQLIASYNSAHDIKDYIKGWLNSYVALPTALYDSFLDKVNEAVLSDPSTANGEKIDIPYTALILRAVKES